MNLIKYLFNLLVIRPNKWFESYSENVRLAWVVAFIIYASISGMFLIASGHKNLAYIQLWGPIVLFCAWRMVWFLIPYGDE